MKKVLFLLGASIIILSLGMGSAAVWAFPMGPDSPGVSNNQNNDFGPSDGKPAPDLQGYFDGCNNDLGGNQQKDPLQGNGDAGIPNNQGGLGFLAEGDHIDRGDSQYPCGAAPVPEPATVILLGAGLIGLAGAKRKIKK